MGIITKGMGAILKAKMKAKMKAKTDKGITALEFQRKKSRKVSDLKKAGKTTRVKNVTYGPGGRKRTNYRYVGGPLKGFSTKPYMPRKGGQGRLFREKYEKPKNGDPNVLPGQLKFKFKGLNKVNPEKRLKRAIKKSEVK